MPPQLALLITLGCMVWMLRSEARTRKVSAAAWIPVLWLLVHGSRPVSSWFGLVGTGYAADYATAANEGNPFERNIYFMLIAAALWVLGRRGVNWSLLLREHRAIFILYGFFLLSAVWADAPFVAFKRWFKNFGHVIVALVIVTDTNPSAALKSVCARCAYLLFPLSALFIKYFPELGRVYSPLGEPMFAGVTTQKNKLGEIVFVFGLVLLWAWVEASKYKLREMFSKKAAPPLVGLLLGAWLLYMSRSATSFVCLSLGAGILLGWRVPFVRRNGNALVKWILATTLILFILQQAFDIQGMALEMLGRDRTLTGRTEIWDAVRQTRTNPLLGVGYSSFWTSESAPVTMLGDRMNVVSAHNGYLDVYLDGGIIGLGILLVVLGWALAKVNRELRAGNEVAVVHLAFLIMCIARNFAESTFLRGSPLWFAFLAASMMYSGSRILVRKIPSVGAGPVSARITSTPVEVRS